MVNDLQKKLLREIESFLSQTGMGASYFGKAAVGNSEVVHRLRKGGRVWPETAEKARKFISERTKASKEKAAS